MPQGPVDTSKSPYARWRTLPLESVRIEGGFWRRWQEVNGRAGLRAGFRQLEAAGNFNNLMLAAGTGSGEYREPVFMDSDVYKWLEAAAYQIALIPDDAELRRMSDYAIGLVQAAQCADGYLNSYWTVVGKGNRFSDVVHGHELYCAGHLFQAAVAWSRAVGDKRLLDVSTRFADYIATVFGPDKLDLPPGHPEIEMALVELYRETGERRYLDLAKYFIDARGRDSYRYLGTRNYCGAAYYQDHTPVRNAATVEGHAVRQLYLTSGLADLYLETGEPSLLEAMERQWHNMTSRKMSVSGGLGSQHSGEAFGEPYELSNDACYCETCAQIAGIMWNWRLLQATGEARFADQMEHILYNGFLSGLSLEGDRYFYVNPLLSRGETPLLGRKRAERERWMSCACCPPNVMRTIASLGHYFATADPSGVQVHLYADATFDVKLPSGGRAPSTSSGQAVLRMETDYPWKGQATLRVVETDGSPWTLRLRVPGWCATPAITVAGQKVDATAGEYTAIERAWQAGDEVFANFPMPPVYLEGHPRLDATRGSVALQRGPLLYCVEQADQPGVDVQDVEIDAAAPLRADWRPDLLEGVTVLEARGRAADVSGWGDRLYRPLGADAAPATPVALTAIPYYAWANRGAGTMRVWIPKA